MIAFGPVLGVIAAIVVYGSKPGDLSAKEHGLHIRVASSAVSDVAWQRGGGWGGILGVITSIVVFESKLDALSAKEHGLHIRAASSAVSASV